MPEERGQYDRISDITRIDWPRRHRGVGGIFVSAEIIHFMARPNHHREQTGFPAIAFRSAAQPDDLTMCPVDTSPCEYVWPDECDPASPVSPCGPAAANCRYKPA